MQDDDWGSGENHRKRAVICHAIQVRVFLGVFVTGGLPAGHAFPGPSIQDAGDASKENLQTGSEPVTFTLRGELVFLEGGLDGIRDSEGIESTVVAKRGTVIHGSPKVGDQVLIEYLENGTALIIITIAPNPASILKPEKN